MICGVAPSRSESVVASTAPAPPSGQFDMFGTAPAWSVYSDGLAHYRARLARDGRVWPYLRPYLAAMVERFERLCAGESDADLGPWPAYPEEPGVCPAAGVVTYVCTQCGATLQPGDVLDGMHEFDHPWPCGPVVQDGADPSAGVVTPAEVSRVGLAGVSGD